MNTVFLIISILVGFSSWFFVVRVFVRVLELRKDVDNLNDVVRGLGNELKEYKNSKG